MKIKTVNIFVYPLDDLRCGFGRQQGNILPSLAYIPGRVIRGGLAGWAVRTGKLSSANEPDIKKIFFSDPQQTPISFPCCTPGKAIAAPLSLFELKGGAENPRFRMIQKNPLVFTDRDEDIQKKIKENALSGPIDFLKRRLWPSDMDACLKIAKRTVSYDTLEVQQPFSLKIDLKAAHDEKGRVKEQNGLFAEEAMPASVYGTDCYQGTFVYEMTEENEAVFGSLENADFDPMIINQEKLENAGPDNLIFIGRRKTAAVLYAGEAEIIDTEAAPCPESITCIEKENKLTITFTSDCITSPIDQEPGRGDLITGLLPGTKLKKHRFFTHMTRVHGFDINKGPLGALVPMTAISAGSCGYYQVKMNSDDLKKLWINSLFGIGKHQKDGYGRFIVNWDIHDIKKGGENE